MAGRSSSSSYKLKALVTVFSRYRSISGGSWRRQQEYGGGPTPFGRGEYWRRFMSVNSSPSSQPRGNDQRQMTRVQSAPFAPPRLLLPFLKINAKWLLLLGSLLTLLLPFGKTQWDNLRALEGKAAAVVKEVEVVAEVVEKVATAADKMLTEVSDRLPGDSKLKEAAQAMEHVTHMVTEDAQLVENIVHKVDNVEQALEDLGRTVVTPLVEKNPSKP